MTTAANKLSETERIYLREACFALDRDTWARSLGFRTYAWQKAVLDSQSKRKAILGPRQCGKSTIISSIPCHTAKYYPGSLSIILAPTMEQSQDDMLKVKGFASRDISYPETLRDSDQLLRLDNGSMIEVVTASDKSARGKSRPRVIVMDEASRMDDTVYASAVRPMLTDNPECEVIILSTPNGKAGFFYRAMMSDRNSRWERYRILSPWVPTEDGLELVHDRMDASATMRDAQGRGYAGGWFSLRHANQNEQLENLLEMGRKLYLQEYRCEFVETEDMVYGYEDIDKVFSPDRMTPPAPDAIDSIPEVVA